MFRNPATRSPIIRCVVCGTTPSAANRFEGEKVCDACCTKGREGRDNTTRAVRLQQKSLRGQAQAARIGHNGGKVDEKLDFEIASAELLAEAAMEPVRIPRFGAGGEVLPEHDLELRDTLAAPDAAALDASANRLELVTRIGTDVAAMAIDAAQTVGASNSIEKMFSHQLAVLHNSSMEMMSRATMDSDPVMAVRLMNLGIRAMDVFQRGAVNLKKLRGGNQQVMRIEHVHIAPGAQAIVGQVQKGRRVK